MYIYYVAGGLVAGLVIGIFAAKVSEPKFKTRQVICWAIIMAFEGLILYDIIAML